MFKKLKESAIKSDANLKATVTNNNNNHHGRSRTSSINSVSSQLNSCTGTDADASSVVVSANRGLAVYDASSGGGTRGMDDAARDSDTASITSSVFHSEAQFSELHSRFQHVHRLARGYKAKNQQLVDACKALERERDQLRELMETNQTKAIRRMNELHEQLELDKKAKQDVEINYRLMLSEKDELVHVLRQQVALLKEGKDLPEELKEKIQAGHDRELERKRSLEQQNQELKLKVHELGLQLQLTTAQLEEHVIKRDQLQQNVANLEKQQEQVSKDAANATVLQRQLTDMKLANSALEEQVNGLKEQLKSMLSSRPALVVKSCSTSDLVTTDHSVSAEDQEQLAESLHSMTEQLNDLKEKLDTERGLRANTEEELARERQESQANLTVIDELRASLDQRSLQFASQADELVAVKQLLEEKDSLLVAATNRVQSVEARESELLTKLNQSELNQKELELRVASASSLEQECETLRTKMDAINQLNDYVKVQLLRARQFAPNLFTDETDPTVVTSSTTVSETADEEHGVDNGQLRAGIEQIVSVVNSLAAELTQLNSDRQEEDRLVASQAQRIAEQELVVANQQEAHSSQLQELKSQFQLERSTLQQDCDQKSELIEQLRSQLTDRTNELEQVRGLLSELQLHLTQKEHDAQSSAEEKVKSTNRCSELEQLVGDLRKNNEELEEKNRELTAVAAHVDDLQSEREDLTRKLTEELVQKQQLQAELDTERVRTEKEHNQLAYVKTKLLSLNPVVHSVKDSLNDLRGEWTTVSESASNQLQTSVDILLRRLKSFSDTPTPDTHQSSELMLERDKLQSEVNALHDRLATLDHERDQANVQCMLLKEQLDASTERFAELDQLTEQHRHLESKHAEVLEELKLVRSELENALSEREQFSARSAHLEQSVDAVRTELSQKQTELEQSQLLSDQMHAKLQDLEQELASERSATQTLRSELDGAQSDSIQARKDLLELEQKALEVADGAAQYQKRLTGLWDLVGSLEQRVLKFETTIENLAVEQNARTAEHRTSLSAAENEVMELRASLDRTDSELRSVQSNTKDLMDHLLRFVDTNFRARLSGLQQAFSRPSVPDGDNNTQNLDQLTTVERSLFSFIHDLNAFVQDATQLSAGTGTPLRTMFERLNAVDQELLALEAFVDKRMIDDLSEISSVKTAQAKAELEIERLSEQHTRHVEVNQTLEQRIAELNSELHDLTRTRDENEEKLSSLESLLAATRQSLSETEAELQRVRSALEDNAGHLEQKVALIAELERQLEDLQKVHQGVHSEIASKELECERSKNDLSELQDRLALLVQQMEASKAEHAKQMQDIRLECDQKLESKLREAREEQSQLVKTHQSQLRAAQDSAGAKEKHLKQQLKDVKTRLKQVLQESENLRKSSVTAVTKEQEVTSRLADAETELTQFRSRCEQLTETIEKQNVQMATLQQSLEEARQEARSPRSTIIDEVREQYQKETESLKAEHALYARDMQAEFELQLQAREAELRAQFEKQLATSIEEAKQAQSELAQQRQQLADSVDDAMQENESLRLRIEELESQLRSSELNNTRPDTDSAMVTSSNSNDQSEVQRLRDEVERLTAQLQSAAPSDGSQAPSKHLIEELSVQTEHITPTQSKISATVYPNVSHEPLVLPKSSNWVEQLRNEILHAESIDSLHPAVRSTQYLNSISIEEYEALQCHNADLQNQLHQLSAEFEALRANCCGAHNGSHAHHTPSSLLESVSLRQFNFPPNSPSAASPSGGSLQELVEYEYLRNVLFEYMIGRETPTLAKVLCSLLRFNSEQTKKVLQYEDVKSRTWTIRTVMD